MNLQARCQVCHRDYLDWHVRLANIDVGTIRNYKLQACDDCTLALVKAISHVLDNHGKVEAQR